MEFLRRLAPLPAGDTSQAVAALPPRFADRNPLPALLPATATQAMAEAFDATAERSAVASEPPTRSGLPAAPAQIPARAAPPLPVQLDRAAVAPLHATTAAALGPRASLVPAAQASGHEPSRRVASPLATLAAMSSPAASASHPPPTLPTRRSAASPTPTVPTVSPLSPAAIASRALHTVPQRALIHVTIDRIDLRTPTAPPRTAAPTKPRTAQRSVSLSDYLQQRGRNRSGGAP